MTVDKPCSLSGSHLPTSTSLPDKDVTLMTTRNTMWCSNSLIIRNGHDVWNRKTPVWESQRSNRNENTRWETRKANQHRTDTSTPLWVPALTHPALPQIPFYLKGQLRHLELSQCSLCFPLQPFTIKSPVGPQILIAIRTTVMGEARSSLSHLHF